MVHMDYQITWMAQISCWTCPFKAELQYLSLGKRLRQPGAERWNMYCSLGCSEQCCTNVNYGICNCEDKNSKAVDEIKGLPSCVQSPVDLSGLRHFLHYITSWHQFDYLLVYPVPIKQSTTKLSIDIGHGSMGQTIEAQELDYITVLTGIPWGVRMDVPMYPIGFSASPGQIQGHLTSLSGYQKNQNSLAEL